MMHIVIGDSVAATLRQMIKGTLDAYIVLPPQLAEGPIHQLLTFEGLQARVDWFMEQYQEDWQYYADMLAMAVEAIDEITDETVTVWAADNASEQFGLALVCYLLQKRPCNIYAMNTTKNIAKLMDGKDEWFTFRHTGELTVNYLQAMQQQQMATLLTNDDIATYAQMAERCMQGLSSLRIWQDAHIIEVDERYADELILQYAAQCGQQYVKAVHLIGQIFANDDMFLSDAWIDYRIRALANEGKLHVVGDTKKMQKYEVSIAQ